MAAFERNGLELETMIDLTDRTREDRNVLVNFYYLNREARVAYRAPPVRSQALERYMNTRGVEFHEALACAQQSRWRRAYQCDQHGNRLI